MTIFDLLLVHLKAIILASRKFRAKLKSIRANGEKSSESVPCNSEYMAWIRLMVTALDRALGLPTDHSLEFFRTIFPLHTLSSTLPSLFEVIRSRENFRLERTTRSFH